MITILASLTLVSAKPVIAASSFSDVPQSNWAAPAITFMVDKQIVNGYSDGTFKPEKPVTKAEFAHMYHALFPKVGSTANIASPFSDTKGHWATKDFSALFNQDGWSFADHFDSKNNLYLAPDKQLTRWDFSILVGLLTEELKIKGDITNISDRPGPEEILDTIAGYKDIKTRSRIGMEMSTLFTPMIFTYTDELGTTYDGDLENIKAEILYSVITKGIMAGANGKFRPTDKVTRAEATTILHRLYILLEN